MTRKAKYFSDKLDHIKIIPDDYLKKVKDVSFFIQHSKKIVQKAIFDSEVKKVQAA